MKPRRQETMREKEKEKSEIEGEEEIKINKKEKKTHSKKATPKAVEKETEKQTQITLLVKEENKEKNKSDTSKIPAQKKSAKKKPRLFFGNERTVKQEIRILGIDDSPFMVQDRGEDILVIGAVHRGGGYLEGVISTFITVDGNNATEQLVRMITGSKHYGQLQIIMTDGIALGGFNVIDIDELSARTKIPVIVIIRRKPNFENIKKALLNVAEPEKKLKMMFKAGEVYECLINDAKIFFQCKGINAVKARDIIKTAIVYGNMPESIRTAHLIASGVIDGESRGRA